MGDPGPTLAEVAIKRVYLPPDPQDGTRVLVDRLWPRGLSKEAARVDHWLKDIAPSTELRRWWNHDPARYDEFAARYSAELDANPRLDELTALLSTSPRITLLYAAHDERVNQARVLAGYLASRSQAGRTANDDRA
jgi:uncharacterized protein YeaO (DUF488 family)